MRAHFLQHVPFEGPGSIEPWLDAEGYRITATKLFQSDQLPDLEQIDLLVALGGPMSVNDEERFGWLVPEKRYLRAAVLSGRPVLGICLGAQLIASAMGSSVYPNSEKEIGWFPLQGIPSADRSFFSFPPSFAAFHWHGETFDLPPGAVRLARSQGCENQAFQIGTSVVALQFHLETTPASALQIVSNCRDELMPARYVQREDEILSAETGAYAQINRLMSEVLSFLTGAC
ncbi:MAG: type 1 glutamine amidotransferase [Gammaproteobacteria bacterium]|nr:type 1 glutamine amidotransferase [Gammaproteobacteria bacterium]